MGKKNLNARFWAEIGFATFTITASIVLLPFAMGLPTMTALLPVAILVCLITFGAALVIIQYLQRETPSKDMKLGQPMRLLGAFTAIVLYALAVQFLGFYTSTTVMVPLVAWLFGYREPRGLALATVVFVGGTYVIFSLLMGQRFPEELLLGRG